MIDRLTFFHYHRLLATFIGHLENESIYVDSMEEEEEFDSLLSTNVCPICLETLKDRARLETCLHSFCFTCILQWSDWVKECPLCKQPFTYVIHGIISDREFRKVTIIEG